MVCHRYLHYSPHKRRVRKALESTKKKKNDYEALIFHDHPNNKSADCLKPSTTGRPSLSSSSQPPNYERTGIEQTDVERRLEVATANLQQQRLYEQCSVSQTNNNDDEDNCDENNCHDDDDDAASDRFIPNLIQVASGSDEDDDNVSVMTMDPILHHQEGKAELTATSCSAPIGRLPPEGTTSMKNNRQDVDDDDTDYDSVWKGFRVRRRLYNKQPSL